MSFYIPDADISTTTLQEAREVAITGEAEDRRKAMDFFAWQARKYADTAQDEIVSRLSDPEAAVRSKAAVAFKNLRSLSPQEIERQLDGLWRRDRFAAALASAYRGISNQAVANELLAGLQRREPFSDDAAGGFKVLGSSAATLVLNDLVRLIDSKDKELSCDALMVLAETRSAPVRLVGRMREWIKQGRDCDWQAAAVLGSIGPPAAEAVPDLVSRIHGKAGECCSWYSQYLVSIGTASIPALLPVAREQDEYRRAWASWALAQLAADTRVPLTTIEKALCDPSPEVVLRTKEGLTRAGVKTGRLARFFDARKQEFRSKTCRGSYRPPAAAIPRGDVPPVLENALESEIIPSLLKDLDGEKRQEALRTLSELGPYAATAVRRLLRDLNAAGADDRRMIAKMLGSIGAEPDLCVPALMELMKDSDTWTSDAAFESLALFGEAAAGAVPAMLEKLKSGKISSYAEENFASLRGRTATAALPYYRSLSVEEDEVKATRGVRILLRIALDNAAIRRAALAEAVRGPSRRRCLVAGELLKELPGSREVRDLPILSDESCRKNLEGQPGFGGLAADLPLKPVPGSVPRLKIQLSLAERSFYVGEPIEVTPNIAGWPEPAERHPRPSFYRDAGLMGGFNLLPDVWTSTGELVEAGGVSDALFGGYRTRRRGAETSWAMGMMMANGFVTPRPGSVYVVGRPATLFIREPGLYKVAIPETAVHVKDSTGPLNAVSADPVEVTVIPATDAFLTQTLREIETELTSTDAMERGWAAERLRGLNNERAIPVLLRCLEDEYKNVLMPALLGLLEYPRPESVAREIRKAIGESRPTRPTQIRWYADLLARTEHGWPGNDLRSRIRVDADSAKWRLLLEHRQKRAFQRRTLSPADAIEGLKNGFVSPETPGACDAAWKGLLAKGKPEPFGVVGQIVAKCGDKASSPILWKIVRSERFDSLARSSACRKLFDLGDKDALDFILADTGALKPVLSHGTESLSIMKAAPKAVSDIVLRKLASNDDSQTRFAATLLWSLDTVGQGVDLPIDPGKLREALLACRENACDSVTWGHVARYLGTRSPQDALGVIEAMLLNCKKDQLAGCGGPMEILAMLPADVGGALVRKLLSCWRRSESVQFPPVNSVQAAGFCAVRA